MLFLKLIVAAAFIGVGYMLYVTWRHARNRHTDAHAIFAHRDIARKTLFATLFAVIITEVMVRVNGGVQDLHLFWVHIAFAAPFLLLLTIQQWLTGFRTPMIHKALGYSCLVTFVGTLVTGGMLLTAL